ncbi:MAG: trehalose utilization protein ThuA [Lentisphaerae bacterium]|nr:MAG: trehalose utilization protein ThuA [Lentisphaerota bacterium]
MTIRATVWNEFRHEKSHEKVRELYPEGMHKVIADALNKAGIETRLAALDDPEHGLTEDVLEQTDVLFWWGHCAHHEVKDEIVERVYRHIVERGMGLIVLHSGHFSKIFKKVMGTTGNLKWRECGERERLWVVNPAHPIAAGLGEYIELPHTEMYGEYFDIADPDELVFISWFQGGEVFRSGCCWRRGKGKVFYFRPGHETYPIFYNEEIQKVLVNATNWAAFKGNAMINQCQHIKEPLEPITQSE